MKIVFSLIVVFGLFLIAASPSPTPASSAILVPQTLKAYGAIRNILVGTVLGYELYSNNPDLAEMSILAREYDIATAAVDMRTMEPIQGAYDFSVLDKEITLGKKYNLTLIESPLISNNVNRSPDWLKFNQPDQYCGGWTSSQLQTIMKNYIQTVMLHAGNNIKIWNVVNEPILAQSISQDCYYKIDPDYVAQAFSYAAAVRKLGELLMLNENFGWAGVGASEMTADVGINKSVVDSVVALVKSVKSRGIPLDIVGIEMHLDADQLHSGYVAEFTYFLQQMQKIGVQVAITEMDVYQGNPGVFPNPFANQAAIYKNIVGTCTQFLNCKYFLTWGTSDKYTWLKQNPSFTNPQPLLFDANMQKKPSYYSAMQALDVAHVVTK